MSSEFEGSTDQMQLMIFELLHALVRETAALESAIQEQLAPGEGKRSSAGHFQDEYQKSQSLYRDLEWRIARKELTVDKISRILGLVIRQTAFFQITVQNFFGSITQNQQIQPSRKPVRLVPLIEEVVDLFEYSAITKGVEIRTQISGNPTLIIDRGLIHRVLVNLIDNAVKYSYSSAESAHQRYVSVDCRRHSARGDWMIAIASYGVGIEQDEISSGAVFQYGTRGRFSNDRGRTGTGIGLAEAKRLTEAHHGRLLIESNKISEGTFLTVVRVILPST